MNNQMVINGQLVSYSEFGSTNLGPALIFLHGWRSNKEVWLPVVSKIKDKGSRIFILDLPGFGSSPIPKETWTVGDYSDFVAGLITKLKLVNVVVVGHSFGGRIAIKLASQHPKAVEKLVLVDSAGFAMNPEKKVFINFMAKIAKPFFKPRFMQSLRRKIYKVLGSEDYLATPELRQTFIETVNEDLTEDIKQIKQPTLIVWGKNDQATPLVHGERMHKLISNSQFSIFKDAGHFSFLDQPEDFAIKLREFVKL